MRNKNWALDIPQYDVRAFQKVGRTMALYDSWGSDSSSNPYTSYGNYGGYTTGSDSNATNASEASTAQNDYSGGSDYRTEGRNYANGSTRPVNTSTWSIRGDTVYGNLQDAARDLGVKPSELNARSWAANPLSKVPYLSGLNSFFGRLQDMGLPGYAMTPEERDEAEANRFGSTSGPNPLAAGVPGGASGGAANGGSSGLSIPGIGDGSAASMSSYWQGLMDKYQAPTWQSDPSGLLGASNDMYDYYEKNVQPAFGAFRDQVNQFNDSTYRGQQRGQAMAGVQQSQDLAWRNNMQSLARRGNGLSAGAQAEAAIRMANATSANKVLAAIQSDAALRDAYIKGNKELLTAGNEMGGLAAKFGAVGVDAEKTRNQFALNEAELGLKNRQVFAGLALNEQQGLMDAAIRKYGIDNNVAINESNNDSEILGTVLGSLFSGGIKAITG